MPHALELPWVLRAVVPLMSGERFAGFFGVVVHELVAIAFGHSLGRGGRLARRCPWLDPSFAPVVGALDDLPKPATGLRRIQPIRISRRSLDMVDLPASKLRATDVPAFALAVGRQNERTLACANQYSDFAHALLLPVFRFEVIEALQQGPPALLHAQRRLTSPRNVRKQSVLQELIRQTPPHRTPTKSRAAGQSRPAEPGLCLYDERGPMKSTGSVYLFWKHFLSVGEALNPCAYAPVQRESARTR